MKKIIPVLLLLLVVAAGGVLLYRPMQQKRAEAAKSQELQRKMVPLQQEKREMLNQMAQLQRQYDGKMQVKTTVQLFFSDLGENLYLDAFPMMLQYGFKGILVLSETQYPGAAGAITVRQFEEMLRDGWSYCLAWDGEKTLWDAFTAVQWKMPEQTLQMPDTVYLEPGRYRSEMESTLTSQGVRVVVHHGEEGAPLDLVGQDKSLWQLGAWTWEPEQARMQLTEALKVRKNLALDIRLSSQNLKDPLGFQDMLYANMTYQRQNQMSITDMADLKALYTAGADNYRWVRIEEIQAEMSRLQQEMDVLDLKIRAVSNGEDPDQVVLEEKTQESDALMTLRAQRDKFDREHPLQQVGTATVELLFSQMDTGLYAEIFPQLHARKMKGTLVLSEQEWPGQEGKLSWEQVKGLLQDGWELALCWDGKSSLETAVSNAQIRLSEQGLDVPKLVYFMPDLYTEAADTVVEKLGFTVAIHHGETGLSVIDWPNEGTVWKAGAISWNSSSTGSILDPMMDNAQNLVIAISWTDRDHPYLESGLGALLEGTADSVNTGRLSITSFTEAKALQEQSREARNRVNKVREDGLAQLDAQIAALEAENAPTAGM